MAQEEDGDAGPGPPSRVQHGNHVSHDRLPAVLLGDEAETIGRGGGPVTAVVLSQDRVPLLHRGGGEAGVARGVLGHAVGDEDDAPGTGGAGHLRVRRHHGADPGAVLGHVGHPQGAIDKPLGEPDVDNQTRSVVGREPSKAGLHRILLRQHHHMGRRSRTGRHRSSLIVPTTDDRRRCRSPGHGPCGLPPPLGRSLVLRCRAGSVTAEVNRGRPAAEVSTDEH